VLDLFISCANHGYQFSSVNGKMGPLSPCWMAMILDVPGSATNEYAFILPVVVLNNQQLSAGIPSTFILLCG
jgi:hypothetical protein